MELLVAIGIFAIFLGVATSSYISIVRGQSDTNERRKMISDVRTLMDYMTDELRNGTVDYWWSYCDRTSFTQKNDQFNPANSDSLFQENNSGVTNEFERSQRNCETSKIGFGITDRLVITSKDGSQRTTFEYQPSTKKVFINKQQISVDDFNINTSPLDSRFTQPQEFTLANTQIDSLKFKINPLDDPYASRNYQHDKLQFQPQVTVLLTAGIPANQPELPAKSPVHIQTTLSSRLYSPRL